MTREFHSGATFSRCAAVALSAALSPTPGVSQPRPVVTLDTAVTAAEVQELFVRDTAPAVSTVTRSYYGRLFTALLPAKRYPENAFASDIETSALSERPFDVAEADSSAAAPDSKVNAPDSNTEVEVEAEAAAAPAATPSDNDANFKRWEAEAKQRLKQENEALNPKESPLTALHPESYITVCEAGCRGQINEVVYTVAKAEAANAQVRGYVPTSAESGLENTDDSRTAKPVDENSKQAQALNPNTIDCVAGCYNGPKTLRARPDTASAAPDKRPNNVHAAAIPAAPVASRNAANVRVNSALPARAKVDRRLRHSGLQAKVKAQTAPAPRKPATSRTATQTKTEAQTAKGPTVRAKIQRLARHTSKKPGWRTKLIRASAAATANLSTAARAGSETATEGTWKTRVSGAALDATTSK